MAKRKLTEAQIREREETSARMRQIRERLEKERAELDRRKQSGS